MKVLFALLTLCSLSFACVCATIISSSFSNFANHITAKLQAQSSSLSVLTQSIQNNIQTLKSQNILLKQELALLEKEALQNKELLFLLKQRNELE